MDTQGQETTISITQKTLIALLAGVAVVASAITYAYQKMSTQARPVTFAQLPESSTCTLPTGEVITNERKQLYVGCAGFID